MHRREIKLKSCLKPTLFKTSNGTNKAKDATKSVKFSPLATCSYEFIFPLQCATRFQEKKFDAKRAATRRKCTTFFSSNPPRPKDTNEKKEADQQECERTMSLAIHECLESLFAKQALTLSFVSGFLRCMGSSYFKMQGKLIKDHTMLTFMTLDILSASYLANPENEICEEQFGFVVNKLLKHKPHQVAYEKYHLYFDDEVSRLAELINLKKFLLDVIDEQLEQLEVFFEEEMILILGELFFQWGHKFQTGEIYRQKSTDKRLPNPELAMIFYQTASELGHVEAKSLLATMKSETAESRPLRSISL